MTNQPPERLLRIGLPSKGRLAEISAQLLNDAGVSFRRPERSLFARCRDMPVEVTFLRTDDIPVLAAEGAIDLGITGAEVGRGDPALGEERHVGPTELGQVVGHRAADHPATDYDHLSPAR